MERGSETQLNSPISEDVETNRLLPNCFIEYQNFYSEKELTHLLEFFKKIFFTKTYKHVEEVCLEMHHYMQISKYNLKRNHIKDNLENQTMITFVCSCISKKSGRSIQFDRNDSSEMEVISGKLPQEKFKLNLSDIFKQEKEHFVQIANKSKIHTESNSLNCNFNCTIFKNKFTQHNCCTSDSTRAIKRTNTKACKFRIKFIFDNESKTYKFNRDSNLEHNHPPGNGFNYLSVEDFSIKSRNIKFSLKTINFTIKEIIDAYKFQKLKDKANRKKIKLNSEAKIKLISKIREIIWNKTTSSKYTLSNVYNKRYRTNLLKKLTYFIKTIFDEYEGENLSKLSESWKEYDHVYRFIMRKGANYLRQDSLHTLISEISKNCFEKYKENIEGKINILYNYLEYIENFLHENMEEDDEKLD